MPPINLLIKPASSACNMQCKYCFYNAIAQARETAFEGMLQDDMLVRLIDSGFAHAEHLCSFAFQGGEPTLAGLQFYRRVTQLQKQRQKPGLRVQNALQTNGYIINAEWAQFLHDENFLVGLSLDGPAVIHNENRVDIAGKGTFARVMNAARLFDRYKVQYNILCVVTGKNARSIEKIYRFYRKNGFNYLQFIPCLEPVEGERGAESYHLSVKAYSTFLIRIFDLWYADLQRGDYVSIRHIDNWLAIALGEKPEACNMCGQCSVQLVVEGDGGVYPCDFYVYDEWRLGTLGETSLADMENGDVARRFIDASLPIPEKCRACSWGALCRNGCRRDRVASPNGYPAENYYCAAIHAFFDARGQDFAESAHIITRMRNEKQ